MTLKNRIRALKFIMVILLFILYLLSSNVIDSYNNREKQIEILQEKITTYEKIINLESHETEKRDELLKFISSLKGWFLITLACLLAFRFLGGIIDTKLKLLNQKNAHET
jgi:hypothetical protein